MLFFAETIKNVIIYLYIKLVARKRRRDYSLSEPNYHTNKLFTENLLVAEMKKIKNTYE